MTDSENDRETVGTVPYVLIRIGIAVATGLVSFAVAAVANASIIETATFSAFIGGVVLIAGFLVDFERQMVKVRTDVNSHTDHMTDLVNRSFADIGEVTELFSQVDASAIRTETIKKFLRHAVGIDGGLPLLLAFAHSEIQRVSTFLEQINNGMAVYPGEDQDWLLALTATCQRTLDATSLSAVDAGSQFWESNLGYRYLEAQEEAIERGIEVRRVFILHRSESVNDPALRRTCRRQADLGIEVRVLRHENIPTGLRDRLFDFILFDGIISYEAIPSATSSHEPDARPTIVRTELARRQEVLARNRQHFVALWAAAEPFVDSPGPDSAPLPPAPEDTAPADPTPAPPTPAPAPAPAPMS